MAIFTGGQALWNVWMRCLSWVAASICIGPDAKGPERFKTILTSESGLGQLMLGCFQWYFSQCYCKILFEGRKKNAIWGTLNQEVTLTHTATLSECMIEMFSKTSTKCCALTRTSQQKTSIRKHLTNYTQITLWTTRRTQSLLTVAPGNSSLL